jgi:hypothetical protein
MKLPHDMSPSSKRLYQRGVTEAVEKLREIARGYEGRSLGCLSQVDTFDEQSAQAYDCVADKLRGMADHLELECADEVKE